MLKPNLTPEQANEVVRWAYEEAKKQHDRLVKQGKISPDELVRPFLV